MDKWDYRCERIVAYNCLYTASKSDKTGNHLLLCVAFKAQIGRSADRDTNISQELRSRDRLYDRK